MYLNKHYEKFRRRMSLLGYPMWHSGNGFYLHRYETLFEIDMMAVLTGTGNDYGILIVGCYGLSVFIYIKIFVGNFNTVDNLPYKYN